MMEKMANHQIFCSESPHFPSNTVLMLTPPRSSWRMERTGMKRSRSGSWRGRPPGLETEAGRESPRTTAAQRSPARFGRYPSHPVQPPEPTAVFGPHSPNAPRSSSLGTWQRWSGPKIRWSPQTLDRDLVDSPQAELYFSFRGKWAFKRLYLFT